MLLNKLIFKLIKFIINYILPAKGVSAPLIAFTAEREKLAHTGQAPKKEPTKFDKPNAINSCVESIL